MVCAFPCGEPATVLQAEANEEVDFSVGHPNKKNGYSARNTVTVRYSTKEIVTQVRSGPFRGLHADICIEMYGQTMHMYGIGGQYGHPFGNIILKSSC
jgi:hypothetical protein